MSGNKVQEVPFAGKWKEFLIQEDGEEIVPKPAGNEATKKIWTSQIMIPFSMKKDVHSFCGPYPDAESVSKEVSKIFPNYVTCGPRIFETTNNPLPIWVFQKTYKTVSICTLHCS
jgi:hypothetical protein